LGKLQEVTDESEAAGAALLKDQQSSGKDTPEKQLASSRAEEGVNGVVLVRAVTARPVVESSVRDAELLGKLSLGRMIRSREVVQGSGDIGTPPTERVLARQFSIGRLIGRHGSFPCGLLAEPL
jgi:hypothetical protein